MYAVHQNVNLRKIIVVQEEGGFLFWSNSGHPTIFIPDFSQWGGKAPTENFF